MNTEFENMPDYQYDDGGRKAAGFKGTAGDCGTRAIAIATGKPYREVYDALQSIRKNWKGRGRRAERIRQVSARNGTFVEVVAAYMESIGWIETKPKRDINSRLLPRERAVLYKRKHYVALVNNTVRDTWDSRLTKFTHVLEDGEVIPRKPVHVYRMWTPA